MMQRFFGVVMLVVLVAYASLGGACVSKEDRLIHDLGVMVPDNTAQKREAVELVDRAYRAYHDASKSEQRRVVEAAELLERAIRLDPGFATAHLNLGVLHLEQENYPTAISLLRRAQLLMPSDARPSYHLGVTYYKMGHSRAAIDSFLEAAQADPADHRAIRGLALACRSVHYATDMTVEVLRRARTLEPDENWRRIVDREIARQQRQLEVG